MPSRFRYRFTQGHEKSGYTPPLSWFIKYLDYLVALAVYGPMSTSDFIEMFDATNISVWDFRRAYEGLKIISPMKVQYSHEKAHRLNPYYPAAKQLKTFLLEIARLYPPPPIRRNRSTVIPGWPLGPVCRLNDMNYEMFMSQGMARTLALLSFAKGGGATQRQIAKLAGCDERSLVRTIYRLRSWKFVKVKRIGTSNLVSLNQEHPLIPSLQTLMRRIDAADRIYRHLAKSVVLPKPPKKPETRKKFRSRLSARRRTTNK